MDREEHRRQRLKSLIDSKYSGIQRNLINQFGLNSGEMSRILSGKKAFGERKARNLERIIGLQSGWLDHEDIALDNNVAQITVDKVPLVNWVSAGFWTDIQELEVEEYVLCPVKHSQQTYALKVKGISMYNPSGDKSFREGDLIFVDASIQAEHMDFVVAMRPDSQDATFKQLIKEDGKILLMALNPEWTPKFIEIDDRTSICGVVIAKVEPLK